MFTKSNLNTTKTQIFHLIIIAALSMVVGGLYNLKKPDKIVVLLKYKSSPKQKDLILHVQAKDYRILKEDHKTQTNEWISIYYITNSSENLRVYIPTSNQNKLASLNLPDKIFLKSSSYDQIGNDYKEKSYSYIKFKEEHLAVSFDNFKDHFHTIAYKTNKPASILKFISQKNEMWFNPSSSRDHIVTDFYDFQKHKSKLKIILGGLFVLLITLSLYYLLPVILSKLELFDSRTTRKLTSGLFYALTFSLVMLFLFQNKYILGWTKDKISDIEAELERREVLGILKEGIPNYDTLSELEKVNTIRKWASLHFDTTVGEPYAIVLDHHSKAYLESPVSVRIKKLLNNTSAGGLYCSGKSLLLADIYNLLGFSSFVINYGFQNTPYTHVVTAVKINDDFFIQDAHLNIAYFHKNKGSTMSLYNILRNLILGRDHLIESRIDGPNSTGYFEETHVKVLFKNVKCEKIHEDSFLCKAETPEWHSSVPVEFLGCKKISKNDYFCKSKTHEWLAPLPIKNFSCEKVRKNYYICKEDTFVWQRAGISFPNQMGKEATKFKLKANPIYSLLHPIGVYTKKVQNIKRTEYKYLRELFERVETGQWSAKDAFKLGKQYFHR